MSDLQRNLGLVPEKPTVKYVQLPLPNPPRPNSPIEVKVDRVLTYWSRKGFLVSKEGTKAYAWDRATVKKLFTTPDFLSKQNRKYTYEEITKAIDVFRSWLEDEHFLIIPDLIFDRDYKRLWKRINIAVFIYNGRGKTETTKSWFLTALKGKRPIPIPGQKRTKEKEEEIMKSARSLNVLFKRFLNDYFPDRPVPILQGKELQRSAYYKGAIRLRNFFNRHPGLKDTITYQFKEHYMVNALFHMNEDRCEQIHPGWLGTEIMTDTLERYYQENGGAF